LEHIVPVKFHENFSGVGHIHIPDFEIDPTISHILKVLVVSLAAVSLAHAKTKMHS
jgi:hypothetical protein